MSRVTNPLRNAISCKKFRDMHTMILLMMLLFIYADTLLGHRISNTVLAYVSFIILCPMQQQRESWDKSKSSSNGVTVVMWFPTGQSTFAAERNEGDVDLCRR